MASVSKEDKLKLQDLLKKLNDNLQDAAQQMTSLLPHSEDDLLDLTILIREMRDLRQKVQKRLIRASMPPAP